MYLPPAFNEDDHATLVALIGQQTLGLLISHGADGLLANLIPFEVSETEGRVMLTAHMARANSQWNGLDGREVLVVFQGADAYVSPRWYASKREHGKVVPTWNYAVVQARGMARVIEDRAWLRAQVGRITDRHEARVEEGAAWKVSDAPADFIEAQLKGIVGLEIAITQLTGKLKASQNRTVPDRAGVAEGLALRHPDMAALVKKGL